MNSLPLTISVDVDGTLTDGTLIYDAHGNVSKAFHTYDSHAFAMAKAHGIEVVIVTADTWPGIHARAQRMGAKGFRGVADRYALISAMFDLSRHAHFGDDTADIPLMLASAHSGCPSSAHHSVKAIAKHITSEAGGQGAFRAYVEHLLRTLPHGH